MDRLAAADAGIVLNQLSNMKLKSGIPPLLRHAPGRRAAWARLRQLQRHRRAERVPGDEDVLFDRGGQRSGAGARAWRTKSCATRHSATRAPPALLDCLGAIKPGYKADLILIDLNDVAYLPYNSAARQLVYTEAGRGVDTVMVGGRLVIKERVVKTIDEEALRREVASLMRHFIADYDAIVELRKAALPHMLEAHHRVWAEDIGMERFIPRAR